MILKALSFGIVGVINTAVDAAVFFLALGYFTSSLIAANIMAWVIAVSNSYVLNSFTTFAAESGRRLLLRAYLMFLTAGLFGLVANTLTLITAALFLPVWAAKALAIGASFLVNFSLSHTVVFRSRRRLPELCTEPVREVRSGHRLIGRNLGLTQEHG